jgi:hypothetical protein
MLKVVLHNSKLKEACGLSIPDSPHIINSLEMLEETIDLTAKSQLFCISANTPDKLMNL